MVAQAKTALITGCGRRRLGHVVAQYLAQQGWQIAVHCHRSVDQAEQNAESYRAHGVVARVFAADVADETEVRKLVAEVVQEFGGIDLLLTTSSIWRSLPLESLEAKDVLKSFQVNTLGTFLCCQHAGLQMVRQSHGGNIITIGDSLASHPYKNYAAYFTAKGAIATMTRAFAVELGDRNPQVRVNCIAPGPVMFPDELPDDRREWVVESTLTKVANHPQSIVNTVEYLLKTPMVTGTVIPVDSGRNVGREQKARQAWKDVP